ncbi:MAG: pyruvate kinase [Simkaniaceae bacterium]
MTQYRRTKIICTIGPSCSSEKMIDKLLLAGMNVARLNFSHGTHEDHGRLIERLKNAREKRKVPLAIMLDTKGPELRVGKLLNDEISLQAKQKIKLVPHSPKESDEIPILPKSVLQDLKKGMHILFDDGYVSTKVIEVQKDKVIVEVENPGILKSHKGINIPHENISLPAMTEQDIEDIQFGCDQDIDIIAASFIRSPEHIMEIRRHVAAQKNSDVLILAKIENAEGVKNFDGILQVSDGIMVARGDLGVEMPLERVPNLQKMMIKKCYHLGKPVITATQMLESMIHSPRPTRAEVSDVANAIYDSTSAVMLSGETAVGKYPIQTVKMMRGVIEEAEKEFGYEEFFSHDIRKDYFDVSASVALATVKTAYSSKAKAIFAFTSSGKTARAMSRFRPRQPILALTPNRKSYHQMAINWGLVPFIDHVSNVKEGFESACCFALQTKLARYGDLVVISAGSPFGITGTTNTMIVENIGDVLVRGQASRGKRVFGQITLILSADPRKRYHTRGKIVVLSTCDEAYLTHFKHATGIVLENHPDDTKSERYAKNIASTLDIPLLARADGASDILQEGQLVTLDPVKGLIFKGAILSEEEMVNKVCSKKI